MIDATDASFETDVLARSEQAVIVVDLWAPWCGPCKQLGPIIEKVVAETNGQAELVKINIDENPGAAQAFQVQSIPAVYAVKDRQVVDGFVGAQGEPAVKEFVDKLLDGSEPSEVDLLVEAGDEVSLGRALELEPGHEAATQALALLFLDAGNNEAALEILETIPDTPEARHLKALARTGESTPADDIEARLEAILAVVKGDDEARREFVDLLEVLGPEDPRTGVFRRKLTAALY
ncbi:MAG: tetratricopeptide repeat protein [Actinomycetia bacterium]|nr:tetratricopeptide repeat protein [Actinomycetes bacterium]MCP4087509.1 tetratricopeptide repeat protein [Actinomycetes bacterium]